MTPIAPGDTRTAAPAQPGLLRSMNNRVVLDLLIERGELSRGDVRDLTGLSKPTASQLLARLEEIGLVQPSGYGDTGPGGRAPQLYRLNPTAGYAAAVDVRRDAVHCRIADITGTVVASTSVASDEHNVGPDSVAAALAACCADARLALDDVDAVVVGVPGSYDVAGDQLHYVDQLHGWQEPGIGARLRGLVSPAIVSIENDVNLVAVAEHRHTGADDFFLLWLGEGIGGGIVIGGDLHRGARGAAGEAAFLLPSGIAATPETRENGGLEVFAGRDALRSLAEESGHHAASSLDAFRALLDDPAAEPQLQELARRYALALSSVVALLDPTSIVLSGDLATAGGDRLIRLISQQLTTIVVTHPPISLGTVTDAPILEGGIIQSLDLARDVVFAT